MPRSLPWASVLIAIGVAACGTVLQPPAGRSLTLPLISTEEMAGHFLLRQRIDYRFRERAGTFEAVVQKQCNQLLVIGLTPLGTRVFTIRQEGLEVSTTMPLGDEVWPFPPGFVLLDIQRAYLLELAGKRSDGPHELSIAGQPMTETWSGGRLVERSFPDSSTPSRGRVVVRYTPGIAPSRPAGRVNIVNEPYGYELDVVTLSRTQLDCP